MGISEIGDGDSFVECPYTGENGGCETCVLGLSPQECEEALYEYLLNEGE